MPIVLFERLDTAVADEFLSLLQGHEGDFILDGHQVQCIGGKCLAVLLRMQERAQEQGREFCILHPSEALRADLKLLGLSSRLLGQS
ncbi:STAS domain-containing protein [Neokomagataea thailandica]|uniref:STAS domain-containing protein n=1 Tax=Neokomagataea TaxID=1223423 RepID=UPI001471B60C|nr:MULTISPECIES: STAS domain-containing protein [Neokomagataea]